MTIHLGAEPGTYVLVLQCDGERFIEAGSLGGMLLEEGYYTYVGSALGPGGLAGRLRHHGRRAARPHWHIDYLRRFADLNEVWYCNDHQRREHEWARGLERIAGSVIPLARFGASDCRCASHLFYFPRPPSLTNFRRVIHQKNATPEIIAGWTPAAIRRMDATEVSSPLLPTSGRSLFLFEGHGVVHGGASRRATSHEP